MPTTTVPLAVVGRRIEFAYRSARDTWLPGIVTEVNPPHILIRLDGKRSTIQMPASHHRLRYTDTVIPVPDLPMGRFVPTGADMHGRFAGVPVTEFEDGDIVLVTGDREAAIKALAEYCAYVGMEFVDLDLDSLEAVWRTFEWQPEDAEHQWVMSTAAEGDHMALLVHYLP
jgi:hypothetical protein